MLIYWPHIFDNVNNTSLGIRMGSSCRLSSNVNIWHFNIKKPHNNTFSFYFLFSNIGRGRDHGLPPYHKVREHFQLGSFKREQFSHENFEKLKELYKNLNYRYTLLYNLSKKYIRNMQKSTSIFTLHIIWQTTLASDIASFTRELSFGTCPSK